MVTRVLKPYQAYPAFTRRLYTAGSSAKAYEGQLRIKSPQSTEALTQSQLQVMTPIQTTSVYSPTKQWPPYQLPQESLTNVGAPPLLNSPIAPVILPAPVTTPAKHGYFEFLKDKKALVVVGAATFAIIALVVVVIHHKR